jgi:RimJ/RimL family protein N-acetyltransferase
MAFNPQPTLTGESLELRPLRATDFDALYAVASDPLIWEQHPNNDRWKPDVFRAFFQAALQSGGALVAVDRESGTLIGTSRYHGFAGDADSEVEVGWTFLARAYWGGRYNAEMKRLMLDHAFKSFRSVVLVIGPNNLRSQKAAAKIGGVRIANRVGADGLEKVVYRIKAPGFAMDPGDHSR